MKKCILLFAFMVPLMALAQQSPSGATKQSSMSDQSLPAAPADAPVSVDEERIYTMPEALAEFPGGQDALMMYLSKNIQYPEDAKTAKKEGVVYISFVVNQDGRINEVKVLRGLYPSLDKEAIRVISKMPNWKPGTQNGRAVRTQFNLPIRFLLN